MKAKYFTGPDREICIQAAEEHFRSQREQLYLRFLTTSSETELMLLAVDPEEQDLEAVHNMDAMFSLSYTPKGVELALFDSHGRGEKLNVEEMELYLRRKNIQNLNQAAKKMLVKNGWGAFIIAPPQQENILDEEAVITIDNKEAHAYGTILPGDVGGRRLDGTMLRQSLLLSGVVHGLDHQALALMLEEHILNKRYLLASATPPQNGVDGHVQFYFRREFSGRPKIGEDGRVDYRALDLFESVKKGQLLVTRVLATPGTPGLSVKGKEIPCVPGKNARLPHGKNILINEEGTMLRANCSGMVVYANDTINILDVYRIGGDADMKVGNIDFDGSIIIGGNVIPGMTMKASGNIEVGGIVENASLIAGGNIVIKGGVQGMNRGLLQAAGNITASYIERSTVLAGGVVTANIISHCTLEAGESVVLSGRNGSLVGGLTQVSNSLSAQIIGTVMEMPTEIEVGLVPHKRQRISFLRVELKRLAGEIEKLSTIVDYLDRNPSDDMKKISMRFSVGQNLNHYRQLLEDFQLEYEALQEESANAVHGKIHVSDSIYPGVRLTIASAQYRLNAVTEHCTFRVVDGEISMGSYEG